MNTITRDEWLSALALATEPEDPDALTIQELAVICEKSRRSMEERIKRLVDEGKATRHWKTVTNAAGYRRRVSAYKLVKPNA